ncbi:MAG TPA: hypothetical protein VGM13_16055 [Thermoanaerobaculia bacterium]
MRSSGRSSTSTRLPFARTTARSSAWEIPAGYAKIDNPMLKSFEGHDRKRSRS